jgi:predicted transposase/invertase (TIGR01784 family)
MMADQNSFKLLSPRVDVVFNNLFGDDSASESLKSFLSAVLKDRKNDLEDIIVGRFSDLSSDKLSESLADGINYFIKKDLNGIYNTDLHLNKELTNDKLGMFDVKVRPKNGNNYYIKMQSVSSPSIIKKILHNHSTLLFQQLLSGGEHGSIKDVISIYVTDFIFIGKNSPLNTDYHHCFCYTDPDHKVTFPNSSEIHTLELPRVPATSDNSKLWPWMTFLNATTEEEMKRVGQMDPGIEIARKRLIELSADPNIRQLAEWREKQIRDIKTTVNKSDQEGEEK